MAVQTFSGQQLRRLRTAARLTQHDLASRLRKRGFGTTQTTISRWEDGQQPLSGVLPSLAAELDCSIADFYAGEDDDEEAASMPLTRDEQDMLVALIARISAAANQDGART